MPTPLEDAERLLRDLDLLVYRLERTPGDTPVLLVERQATRRELERLRDRLAEILERL